MNANEMGWRATLAEIEQAISHCLADLQKYDVPAEVDAPKPVQRDEDPLPTVMALHGAWDAKLDAMQHHAHDVEKLLTEQETMWNEWRTSLSNWQQSLKDVPVLASGVASAP